MIYNVATGLWMLLLLGVTSAIWRYEDRREAERIEQIRQQAVVNIRRYVAQMHELRQIDNLIVLEAFRIKEGLDTRHEP